MEVELVVSIQRRWRPVVVVLVLGVAAAFAVSAVQTQPGSDSAGVAPETTVTPTTTTPSAFAVAPFPPPHPATTLPPIIDDALLAHLIRCDEYAASFAEEPVVTAPCATDVDLAAVFAR